MYNKHESFLKGPNIMKDIYSAPFALGMINAERRMDSKGWCERNSGNISCLVAEEEAREYIDTSKIIRTIPIGFDASPLAERLLIVTASGSYFSNHSFDDLGIIRISADGKTAEVIWGFEGGKRFTSELPAHLMSHIERLKVYPENRVITHCHPTNLMAMSFLHELDEKAFTRTLWGMCTEGIMVFPDGVGILPWMVCGTEDIGRATAEKMKQYRIVVWAMHGIYAAGRTLNEAVGLIDTVEKAAQIYMLTSSLPHKNCISDENLISLADHIGVSYRKDFLG